MKRKIKYHLAWSAIQAACAAAIDQPRKFFKNLHLHMWILMPVIATQLLQKLQDVVDDRLMNFLGSPALTIHNIQYCLYGLAQEVGLISATSLLIFWKRPDMQSKQKSILSLHLVLTLCLSFIICGVVYRHSLDILNHFKVTDVYQATAHDYMSIGLIGLIFRATFVPISTVLIACDKWKKSLTYIVLLILFKASWAWVCSHYLWEGELTVENLSRPMLGYSIGSVAFSFVILFYAVRNTYQLARGERSFSLTHAFRVWPGEIGIGIVSAFSPLLFTFQIAKANTQAGFFITYQIALHLTCMLTLPVLAGIQVATREAAVEQHGNEFQPMHKSKWWPHFFFASLLPTSFALALVAAVPGQIITWIYGYKIPASHMPFLPIFFGSWILFQWGSAFLVVLRSSRNNHIATRNIMISGFVVQIGMTQVLLQLGLCTPVGIGLVFFGSCLAFFLLNWTSVAHLYWKSKMSTVSTLWPSIAPGLTSQNRAVSDFNSS